MISSFPYVYEQADNTGAGNFPEGADRLRIEISIHL